MTILERDGFGQTIEVSALASSEGNGGASPNGMTGFPCGSIICSVDRV
jgi:hypothetical protein